jgi:Uma2 family endonuclease
MNAIIRPSEIVPEAVPLTVRALRVLDEQGYFNDLNKYELIEGHLIMMPPPSGNHRLSERKTNKALMKGLIAAALDHMFTVQTGGAFQVGETTLLGPDLVVLRESNLPDDPTSEDVVIMIEVSWSSHMHDLTTKAHLYAQANILDYWVIDVPAQAVVVHRLPLDGAYQSVQTYQVQDVIASVKEPSLMIAVADLF